MHRVIDLDTSHYRATVRGAIHMRAVIGAILGRDIGSVVCRHMADHQLVQDHIIDLFNELITISRSELRHTGCFITRVRVDMIISIGVIYKLLHGAHNYSGQITCDTNQIFIMGYLRFCEKILQSNDSIVVGTNNITFTDVYLR